MFFETLNNILFEKNSSKISDVDAIEQFSPYMINRWCSMYSSDMCHIVNQTTNRYHRLFDDKETMYTLYLNLLPRVNKRYIKYIKKKKKEVVETDDQVDLLARTLELSKREISNYIQHDSEHRSTNTNQKPD